MCVLFDENLQPIKLYSCAIKMIFGIVNLLVTLYVEELRTTTPTHNISSFQTIQIRRTTLTNHK